MDIKALAEKYEAYVIEQRRWAHQHAELAWKEFETTAHIEEELRKMGIEPQRFDGLTGCWAMIRGGKATENSKTILLRADIDALATVEKNDVPYKSINEGNMHACGHDTHVAMLLTAAKILMDVKDELEGNVKLFFQGAEETAIGAKYYVDKGVVDDVDTCFACHIASWLDAPYVDVKPGLCTASSDEFKIHVQGKAAHGGMPQNGHDALVAASAIVMNLQTLVSRLNDPRNPLVVTVGRLEAGFDYNIVAGQADMKGCVRTFDRELRSGMDQKIKTVAESTAEAFGCTAEVEYLWKTGPILHENDLLNDVVKTAALEIYGETYVKSCQPITGSDDFAFLTEKVTGYFCFVGGGNKEKNCIYPHHHEFFNIDESALKNGAALYAQTAADYLKRTNH